RRVAVGCDRKREGEGVERSRGGRIRRALLAARRYGFRRRSSSEQSVQLVAGHDAEASQDIVVTAARLWHGIADPYLYQLVADLATTDGTPIDRVVQR